MITLTFNTTLKNVTLKEGYNSTSFLEVIDNVPTVQPDDKGFYTVMVDIPEVGRVPYLRLPIQSTIMRIVS